MHIRELFNGSPKFLQANDFVNLDIKTPKYLVHPFFPTGGTAVLFGRGGAGKTQMALSMAAAVMEGGYFLSKFKARKGKVVLIEVDTPPLVMQDRLRKMKDYHTLDNLSLAMYDSGIDIVDLAKQVQAGGDKPEWILEITSQKPDLVIVDSLRKTHLLDENDSRTPSMVLNSWRYLVGSGTALLFIHHARKTPMEFRPEDDTDGARGSGAWHADLDAQIQLIDKGGNRRVVQWTKIRTCEESQVPPMAVMINPESILVELQEKAVVRALELALVHLEKKEIVQHLVKENLCKQTRAYEIADHVCELVSEESSAV